MKKNATANERVVKVESLTPDMVYLRDDGARMLVLEAGENATTKGAPFQSYFVAAHCLTNWDTTDVHHAASKGTEFRVVDAKTAVYDACTDLNRVIREREAILHALPVNDYAARQEPNQDLEAHRKTLGEVEQAAKRLGVRCRG